MVTLGTGVAFVAVVLLSIVFAASLIAVPTVADSGKKSGPRLIVSPPQTQLNDRAALEQAKLKRELARTIAEEHPAKKPRTTTAPGAPVCAAFYAPWEEGGIDSLRANRTNLSHLMPQWVHLTSGGDDIDLESDFDPKITSLNLEVIQIAQQNGIKIFPIH